MMGVEEISAPLFPIEVEAVPNEECWEVSMLPMEDIALLLGVIAMSERSKGVILLLFPMSGMCRELGDNDYYYA